MGFNAQISSIQRNYFMGVLCFIFILTSGHVARGIREPLNCIGDCSAFQDCNQACIAKGYRVGGVCLGFSAPQLTCCCTRT
ncbi:hypothetical protein ACJIZ3_011916 [Penstemon smallii]|uniref:Uncharacterized protein n=1 Tax=Penstemon smallii TaxID=265156 RepID=A0ABD3UKH7_9LAMI